MSNPEIDELQIGGINSRVECRLAAMRQMLLAKYRGGREFSSASKGAERELFVREFLESIFPRSVRFGSGDITSSDDRASGQVDVVVESPHWHSFPLSSESPYRLYLAEGVAAVIEVKSDLASQWDEVIATVTKVKELRRRYEYHHWIDYDKFFAAIEERASASGKLSDVQEKLATAREGLRAQLAKMTPERDDIPCYAIGYAGWKTAEAFRRSFEEFGLLDGAIILDPPHAVFKQRKKQDSPQSCSDAKLDPLYLRGEWAMATFLDSITRDISEIGKPYMPVVASYLLRLIPDIMLNPLNFAERFKKIIPHVQKDENGPSKLSG